MSGCPPGSRRTRMSSRSAAPARSSLSPGSWRATSTAIASAVGDMRAQMEQTFRNLDRCLKAAGATWADVVKTNTYVTDFDEFQKCGDVRMRYFGVATSNQHDRRCDAAGRPGFHG